MMIEIPSWALPLVGTIAAFAIAIGAAPKGSGYLDFSPLVGCAFVLLAACASLAMWLIWSLVA